MMPLGKDNGTKDNNEKLGTFAVRDVSLSNVLERTGGVETVSFHFIGGFCNICL